VNDRALPIWLRLILLGTATSQLVFGLTLLVTPDAISAVWPWPMTAITARILGASTLVSVPLAVLAVLINRFSVARIPLTMLLTYRAFQLVAGLIHIDRFDFSRPVTWNYFGGGSFMLVILAVALFFGPRLGRPVDGSYRWAHLDAPMRLGRWATGVILAIAVLFVGLGVTFLVLGPGAAPLWFEEAGRLTPLTARLFASPMIGLALALWLITRAGFWREVAVPAVGMTTFGLAAVVALIVERAAIVPPSPLGYLTAATPAMLLLLGLFLFSPGASRLSAPHPQQPTARGKSPGREMSSGT
jgi:hypothetical protein